MENDMSNRVIKKALPIAALVSSLGMLSQQALAGSNLFDPFDGPSTIITGTYITTTTGGTNADLFNADPFVVQIFSSGGECVRVEGLSQGTDLEAVLVSPNGQVWRDDDGAGSLRPLIKAITPSGIRGWYTLQVSHFAGGHAAANYSDFSLAYGRFASTSASCSGATVPFSASVDAFDADELKAAEGGAAGEPIDRGTGQ
jgi:hypothetical protein